MVLNLGPIELVVLQGTPFCNLNCSYCYLSAQSRRQTRSMPIALVARVFEEVFGSRLLGKVLTVNWHGGEPLTLPISHYEEAVETIQALKHRCGRDDLDLRFHIQTNGILINDAWCEFFRRHAPAFEIGVSCDGPAALHDRYRLNWSGRPTFQHTLRGMDLLASHGVKYHVIAVVPRETLNQPDPFVDFFDARKGEMSGFHFNFLAELDSPDPALRCDETDAPLYYDFVRSMLRRLRRPTDANGPLKVRNLAQFYAKIFASADLRRGNSGSETSFPFRTLNVDVEGNVTTFHAGLWVDVLKDAYGDGAGLGMGNIWHDTLEQMAGSRKLAQMVEDFQRSQAACERECQYYGLCSGGYEIVKKKRYGTFEAAETTECRIHVKTVADALLDDLDEFVAAAAAETTTAGVGGGR